MRVAETKLVDWIALIAAIGLAVIAAFSPWPVTSVSLALLVATVFAFAAWLLRGVDLSGAVAGSAAAFVFYRLGGWRMFGELFLVFILTFIATKIATSGHSRGRTAVQVSANLIVSMAVLLYPSFRTYTLVLAVLAELAADTVSSEIGEAFGGEPRLITNLRKTARGANGGVTVIGTMAGIGAATIVSLSAWLLGLRGFQWWIPVVSGVLGMFVDSLLGAEFENKGWLNNEAVNLVGTISSAAIALGLFGISS